MNSRHQLEVTELHQFFQGWLDGTLPAGPESFARLANVLAPEFSMITPQGRRLDRTALVARLRDSHGHRPGLRITIANARSIADEGGLHLCAYEEWQRDAERVTGRVATVVFRDREGAPRGVEWVYVHETWLAPERGQTT